MITYASLATVLVQLTWHDDLAKAVSRLGTFTDATLPVQPTNTLGFRLFMYSVQNNIYS